MGKRGRYSPPMTGTQQCALIVEDDQVSCQWLEHLLWQYGYDSASVGTLAEAHERLNGCCCVILDLALPDGNGVEILRRIRHDNLPIKVAVLTGTRDYSALSTVIMLKPDALLFKPVEPTELMSWLNASCI
jgi:DNA-binding response OmpR family regulator